MCITDKLLRLSVLWTQVGDYVFDNFDARWSNNTTSVQPITA